MVKIIWTIQRVTNKITIRQQIDKISISNQERFDKNSTENRELNNKSTEFQQHLDRMGQILTSTVEKFDNSSKINQ